MNDTLIKNHRSMFSIKDISMNEMLKFLQRKKKLLMYKSLIDLNINYCTFLNANNVLFKELKTVEEKLRTFFEM